MNVRGYHIVSDIHGEAKALHALFNQLQSQNKSGYLTISIGDLIDRGADHIGAIKATQSNMYESLLGNHELNNIWLATKVNGEYLRPHTKFNMEQHESFVNQVTWGSADHDYVLKFFQERPVFMELEMELEGNLHLAHACWHQESIDYLKNSGALGDRNQLGRDGIQAYIEDEDFKDALEMVLYGPVQKLPDGFTIIDPHGIAREHARNLWMLSASELADRLDLNGETLNPWQRDFVNASALDRDFGTTTGLAVSGHYSLDGEPKVPKQEASCCCIDFRYFLTALTVAANDEKFDQKNMTSVPLGTSLKAA